jgi:hypothetical protein
VRVKHKLMDAVAQQRGPVATPARESSQALAWSRFRLSWTSGAAAGAAAVITLTVLLGGSGVIHQPEASTAPQADRSRWEKLQQQLINQRQTLAQRRDQLQSLTAAQQKRQSVVQLLQSDHAQVVPLTAASGNKAWGRLLWDQNQKQGYILTKGLAPTEAGKTYTLWLTTREGRALAVRSFNPDDKSSGVIRFELPEAAPAIDHIRKASISVDPTTGVEQPQSPMLSGRFSTTTASE